MIFLDHSLYGYKILWYRLIECDDLLIIHEPTVPMIGTLDREVVHTSDEMVIEQASTHLDRFWLRWMCDIENEEGHM